MLDFMNERCFSEAPESKPKGLGWIPDPGIKMVSPVLPWLVDSLPLVPPGKSVNIYSIYYLYEVK